MTAAEKDECGDPAVLVKRIRALSESEMRKRVFLERMQELSPQRLLELLAWLSRRVEHRDPVVIDVLDAVHQALADGQRHGCLYETLAEVYRLARQEDNQAVAAMLLNAAPQRGPLTASQVRGDVNLSRLTLGERKFLARGHDRNRLEKLLRDPEPGVIRNLLRNPNLTEQEVVGLAARRPTRDVVQRQISASRFGKRYSVRVALVCNPYSPTDLSLKLVGFLLQRDLKLVRNNHSLHPLVRAEADRLYGTKIGRAGGAAATGGAGRQAEANERK